MNSSSSFAVRLSDEYLAISAVPLVPRGRPVSDLTRLLGSPDRIVSLKHNNTVYIYDGLGIRFWAENNVVGEFQFVLETATGETLPKYAFGGFLEYQGTKMQPPVPGSLFARNGLPGFVQDTDLLQYRTVAYDAKFANISYSAIMSKQTGNLQYLSVY